MNISAQTVRIPTQQSLFIHKCTKTSITGDQYVFYQCKNFGDYETYKREVEEDGQDINIICDYPDKAEEYVWINAIEYGKQDRTDHFGDNIVHRTYSTTYDVYSIMHYASWQSIWGGLRDKKLDYPMVKWENGPKQNPTEDDVEVVDNNRQITANDVEGLVRLYPW